MSIKVGSNYFEFFKTYLRKIGFNEKKLESVTKDQALQVFQKADAYDGSVDNKATDEFFLKAVKELYAEQIKLEKDIDKLNKAWSELSGEDGVLTADEVELDINDPTPPPSTDDPTSPPNPDSDNPSTTPPVDTDDSLEKKSLENLTAEELATELNSASENFNKKQTELSDIQTGKSSALSEQQGKVDDSYNAYEQAIRAVDEQLADEISAAKSDVDTKKAAVDENEALQMQQKATVDICKTAYNSSESAVKELEARLGELNGIEDDENGTIAERISYLQGEIDNAKAVRDAAKKALEDAEKDLEKTEEERKKLDSDLEQAEKVLAEAEAKVPEDNEAIKAAKEAWEAAKTEYETTKTTMIAEATKTFNEAKDYVNEVQTAKISAEKELVLKNSSPDIISDEARTKLEEAARNVIGTFGLCLGGVSHSLKQIYGGKCLDGLRSAYMARDALRGKTPGYEDIASHFTEVQVEKKDLINLPSGYIVVFDKSEGLPDGHIFITLGNGWESSDHIDRMGILGSDFTVFAPTSI